MYRRFCSILVIIFTMIYSCTMLYLNKDYISEKYKEKKINIFESIKNFNVQTILNKEAKDAEAAMKKAESETTPNATPKKVLPKNTAVDDEKTTSSNNSINKEKFKLTPSDREKMLDFAKALSPIDQNKIEEYIRDVNDADLLSALNLFKKRFSDKEYERLKNIEKKYIIYNAKDILNSAALRPHS